MEISLGNYVLFFENGGIRVAYDGKTLYFNLRPVYVSVKTYAAINEFRDIAYSLVTEKDGTVTGEAVFVTKNGSEVLVRDTYGICDGKTLKIARYAEVQKAGSNDLGFQTKISFYQAASDELRDFDYFSPGQWYLVVQLYLITKNKTYLDTAIKAGEWAWQHQYRLFEYRGGPCDTSDIMDKESGIYAMFAFVALYDATEEAKWLEAACGAADYTETFTFVWHYPVYIPYPAHPFNRNHISGQSNVSVGTAGGDIYMAACSYAYYRLYLLTDDCHYRDFAEFLNRNCKQANDTDGSSGYRYPGLVNEGAHFSEQEYRSRYHWLPWCTFVEVDPASRFFDTFGSYEIADIEKMPPEEQKRRNRIYDFYASEACTDRL